MSTPARHPVSGQFVSASWDAETRTGATDTASARPPVFVQPADLGTYASEADQVALKLAFAAQVGTVGHPGPDLAGSQSDPDASAGFAAAYKKLTGRS